MTQVWLSGAENPDLHKYLDGDAFRIAINVSAWERNYSSNWSPGFSTEGVEWLAWADDLSCDVDPLGRIVEAMGHPPKYVVGPEAWSFHPQWMPVWSGDGELQPHVGGSMFVTDSVFADKGLRRRALGARRRDSIIGVITGKTRGVDQFDMIISSAWWSVVRNGETQVWNGTKMCRYNASRKSEVRERHEEDIKALGVDYESVLNDETMALAKLAIRSWVELANVVGDDTEVSQYSSSEVAIPDNSRGPVDGNRQWLPDIGAPREGTKLLPGMGLAMKPVTDAITGEESELRVVVSESTPLRRCDNCFLASSCPEYKPGAECAYSIPVEIRSRDQIQGVLQAVLEIQTQRVLLARFAEEISGQDMDPMVGKEMDRLFNLTGKMKAVLDQADTLNISISGHGASAVEAGGGVISKLFGASSGEDARRLRSPIPTDKVLEATVVGKSDDI